MFVGLGSEMKFIQNDVGGEMSWEEEMILDGRHVRCLDESVGRKKLAWFLSGMLSGYSDAVHGVGVTGG